MSSDYDFGNGNNWLVWQWAYVVNDPGTPSTLVFVRGNDDPVFFDKVGSSYVARHGGEHTLTHDTANEVYIVATPTGEEWALHDLAQTAHSAGLLKSLKIRGGQTINVTSYTSDERIEETQRTYTSGGSTTTESFQYDYFASGEQQGRLQFVTLRRKVDAGAWNEIRRVEYDYYGESEAHGTLGDLKLAKRQVLAGSSWHDVAVSYYRYYKQGDTGGGPHQLKFAVLPESYARLAAAVGTPDSATDAQVADYANYYFEYDSTGRVTKEDVAAGARTYTFTYTTSIHPDGYNNWKTKTVETRPDGSEFICYTNYIGQPLIKELKDGSDGWIEYHKYNSDAQRIQLAHPSAVLLYNDTLPNLGVTLKPADGLIEVTDYYGTTGGGAAQGEVQFEKIQRGATGEPIKLRAYEYTTRTAGNATVHQVAKETIYRNDDGTGAVHTLYGYTWHTGTVQMEERVTTLPAVPTSQNGSGVSNTRTERFDLYGNPIWNKDERGYIGRNQYDQVTGALTQTIQDVDTTVTTDEPTGWSTPSGGGKHIISDYEHDDLGRTIQTLGPEHEVDIGGTATNVRTASWTVYQDLDDEVWTAQGYATGTSWDTYTLVNPVSITRTDAAGRTTEEIQATRASTSGKLLPTDTFAQSTCVRWSSNSYTDEGDLDHSRVYHKIPSSGEGASGTNYDQTNFGRDAMGRQNMTKSPGGTISRIVLANVGLGSAATAVYVGTNDTGATDNDPTGGGASGNNMVVVSEREYDNGNDEGDGFLTKRTEHENSITNRVTTFTSDWRGRPTDVDGEVDFYQKNSYDNLNRITKVDRHDTTSGGNLVGRSETEFDDLGHVYQTKRYAVDPSSGTVGNALTHNTWYDEFGNVIKQHPAGSETFSKIQYDSLGRETKSFIGFDTDETSYADAKTVDGDTIFEQTENDYDNAGNVIETRLRRRFHDATGTGELTSPSGSQPRARVTYVAFYCDAIGREQAVCNYGTNGDSAISRSSTIPTRSDAILVSSTEYNDRGEAYKTIDPAGKEDCSEHDDAGRLTKQIENYNDGDPTTGGNDEDVTVEFTYTADDRQATITAKQKAPADAQTTKYIYGTSLSDSDIARSDLLRGVIYPDSDDTGTSGTPPTLSDGADSTYDRVEHKYNRQVKVKETKDQNGNVHAFDYDKLGRQTHDRIITLGSGVDGAIRRISTTYEIRGMVEKITSYDSATVGSGSVINEVYREYNDLELLNKEYQEHSGTKDASTPYVGRNYDESASGGEFTKGLRPTSLRYPDGRLVHRTYGSSGGVADNLNRIDAIKDDSSGSPGATLASFKYMGADMFVIQDLEEPDVKLDLFGGTSGTYAGLDDFDRVIDQLWRDYGASQDRDRFKHGYDRASNRTFRENSTTSSKDEFYTYDGMHRLKNFDRGDLNAGKTAIGGTPVREEDWSLDSLGNWSNYIQKTSGTTDLDQDRTVNKVNEISNITETTGPSWAAPSYDKNGNMTSLPQPSDLVNSYDCTWDAWNRLVKVEAGTTTVADYAYDGLMRRVSKTVNSTVRHFYYSASWQVLEERVDSSSDPDRQFIWGPVYLDHLILRDRDTSEPPDGTLNERIYALRDANWNVTCLIDTAGDGIERFVYDPYGGSLVFDSSYGSRSSSNYDWEYRFADRRLDGETGMCQYRMRNYHPRLALFCSRDPIGYGSGTHLFAYVASRPTVRVDPMGERDCYCEPKDCQGLIAINKKLNAYVTHYIQLYGSIKAGNHGATAGELAVAHPRALRDFFGRDVPDTSAAPMTYIETWIRKLGKKYYHDSPRLKKTVGIVDTADCVKIECFGVTKCIGTDKLGHFFQQGYMYYEIAKLKGEGFATAFGEWTEDLYEFKGPSINPIKRKASQRDPALEIKRWLNDGTFKFHGYEETKISEYLREWGNVARVGQSSEEDLKANLSGMIFYDIIERASAAGTLDKLTFDICDFVRGRQREPHGFPISGSRYEPGIHQIPMVNGWWWQEEY